MAAIRTFFNEFDQRHADWRYSWLGVFVHATYEPALVIALSAALAMLWADMSLLARMVVLFGACCVSLSFIKTIICFRYRLNDHAERLELEEDYVAAMIQLEDQLAETSGADRSKIDLGADVE
ncbi:hypothetical protein AB0L97_20515 [Nocardia sp. NPDC051911]|uniref:hypothetical protein n=1 Tax=Nocardia sp. NPDC051911 TaxID=3154648 RepID=UPI00341D7D27